MLLILNVWETDYVFQKKSIVELVLCARSDSSEQHKYVGVSESKVPLFFCHQNTSHNKMPLSTIITYFIHDFFT